MYSQALSGRAVASVQDGRRERCSSQHETSATLRVEVVDRVQISFMCCSTRKPPALTCVLLAPAATFDASVLYRSSRYTTEQRTKETVVTKDGRGNLFVRCGPLVRLASAGTVEKLGRMHTGLETGSNSHSEPKRAWKRRRLQPAGSVWRNRASAPVRP
jgi:hypothetical protein